MKKLPIIISLTIASAIIMTACGNKKEVQETTTETTEITEENSVEETLEEDENIIATLYEKSEYDTMNYSDHITLGDYSIINSIEVPEVTEEDIENELNLYAQYSATETQITDKTIENHDTVCVSLKFEDGTSYDYIYVTIGEGLFGENLETSLIGMNSGDEKNVTTIFSEDNRLTEYAGKEVNLTMTVNFIVGEPNIPEINDEFVSELTNNEYTSLDSFKEYIRESIATSNATTAVYETYNTILDNSNFKDLTDLSNSTYEKQVKIYSDYAEQSGITYEDMVISFGFENTDDFNEQLKSDAEYIVKEKLLIYALADAVGLDVSNDEYNAYAKDLATQYGYSTLTEFLSNEDVSEIRYYCVLQKLTETYSK